jgi:uncharacterized protein involved in exopolysaccharide biosynthesis
MSTGEIVITAYITLLTAGLGSLFWRQLAEIRGEMAALRTELRGEMAALSAELRGEMAALSAELREEIAGLRRELHAEIGSVRSEIAGLRSDLTQVALAVGTRRPHASEG